MPYTLETNDIVEVRINYEQNLQRLMNVFHYIVTANGRSNLGAEDLAIFATAINSDPAQWSQIWKLHMSDQCTLVSVNAQKIYPTRYPYEGDYVSNVGDSGSPPMPQNVQGSITKVGETATRHGIGHVEVPGLVADQVLNGELTVAGKAALDDLGPTLLLNYSAVAPGTVTMRPVLFNRASPLGSQIVTAFRRQDTVRVARRRTVRVGQ